MGQFVPERKDAMTDPDTWIIECKPSGDGPPMRIRMRHALKRLLRDHGVKCVVVRSPQPGDALMSALLRPTSSTAEALGPLGVDARVLNIAKPSRADAG